MEIKMIVAVIAGLFLLVGAFAGAFFARQNQYKKWLLENRSEVFAKFLELMSQAIKDASDAIYDEKLEKLQRDIKVSEAYNVPINYSRVVRLYLPKKDRERFQKLCNQVWAIHSYKERGNTLFAGMNEKLDEIQQIFESHI